MGQRRRCCGRRLDRQHKFKTDVVRAHTGRPFERCGRLTEPPLPDTRAIDVRPQLIVVDLCEQPMRFPRASGVGLQQ